MYIYTSCCFYALKLPTQKQEKFLTYMIYDDIRRKIKKSEVIIEDLYDFEFVLMKNYIAGRT